MTSAVRLDAVDRRLLHLVAEGVKPDLTELAADLGTDLTEARRRFQRLCELGVVRECVARVEPAAVGVGFTAFLLVRLAQNAENDDVVRQMLGNLEEVEEAHAISGDFDWLVKVRTTSLPAVHDLVTRHLSLLPGFLRAQTCLVLDTACDHVNADVVKVAEVQ